MTYPLLEKAPDHLSPDFIDYLRENNSVVAETDEWILIENCKYHTIERAWYTVFPKGGETLGGLFAILEPYRDWEWRKKPAVQQTVRRWHLHIIEPNQDTNI